MAWLFFLFGMSLLGTLVTAVIQSSSATTVMVVGFVNSGIMKLSNAIGIIMGANIGTTATGWLLVLADVEGNGMFSSATVFALVAFVGIALFFFCKKPTQKNVGIVITAILQNCSASIGILQALAIAGVIEYNVAIPMVIGMCNGACVPVLLSAIGANLNGRRTAFVYLYFNLTGLLEKMAVLTIKEKNGAEEEEYADKYCQ